MHTKKVEVDKEATYKKIFALNKDCKIPQELVEQILCDGTNKNSFENIVLTTENLFKISRYLECPIDEVVVFKEIDV